MLVPAINRGYVLRNAFLDIQEQSAEVPWKVRAMMCSLKWVGALTLILNCALTAEGKFRKKKAR